MCWIPSHIASLGSELIARAAKSFVSALLIMANIMEKLELQGYMRSQVTEKIMEANLQYCRQHYSSVTLHIAKVLTKSKSN